MLQGVVVMPYDCASFSEGVEVCAGLQKRLETSQRTKNDVTFGRGGGYVHFPYTLIIHGCIGVELES